MAAMTSNRPFNQLKVTEKNWVNSYSFVILANHVRRKFESLHEHPLDTFDLAGNN